MKIPAILFVATILGGCATGATTQSSGGPDLSSINGAKHGVRPKLLGEEGETVAHFHARLIARFCAADETEPTVAQIVEALEDCGDHSARCSHQACAALAWSAGRCSKDLELRRAAALSTIQAEMDAAIARNRP